MLQFAATQHIVDVGVDFGKGEAELMRIERPGEEYRYEIGH